MRVAPHPHTGLQTVSWLLEGEVLHRDSVGSEQLIRPGQLNLMTAGRAISHSEESPSEVDLHGVQLWVALPSAAREVAPAFEHHATLPTLTAPGVRRPSSWVSSTGPSHRHGSTALLVGAEATLDAGGEILLPLRPDFEYAALALSGEVRVEGTDLDPGPLLYLGAGRSGLSLRAERPGRVLLLGGEPFEEEIVMWWNFVGRNHEEIARFRREWMEGGEFGTVHGRGRPPAARAGAPRGPDEASWAPPLRSPRARFRGPLRLLLRGFTRGSGRRAGRGTPHRR